VLVVNETRWTTNYLLHRGTLEERKHEKWGHADIRRALAEETLAKCAYCEGFVDDVSFPHVEHIVPKAVKPELAHIWDNLTSACGRCNTAKGAFYLGDDGLLDPYRDDPCDHLRFIGGLVHWDLGGARGELTARQLKLNRLELVRARAKRLEDVRVLLDRWYASDEPLKGVLEEALRLDALEGEFTQTVVAYLEFFGFPLRRDEQAS